MAVSMSGLDTGNMTPVLVVAIASACGFALSTSLQHRVATHAPGHVTSTVHIMRWVIVRPLWIAGALTGVAALILHALALRLGSLSVVQPIMISGVVLAVMVRAFLDLRLPSGPEMRAVTVTVGGLAVFLIAADPQPGRAPTDTSVALIAVLVGACVAAAIFAASLRLKRDGPRSMALGTVAGVLFGVTAVLLKLIATDFDAGARIDSALSALSSWPLWALVVVGVSGVAVNQRAYQMASLSMSMPILNIVDVLTAMALGWIVFDETAALGPVTLVVQGAALAGMAWGLRLLSLSWVATPVQPATKGEA